MKHAIYAFVSAVLIVGFSYSAQAQTDPAADASLGTADTELGTANTTLKAIQTAIEAVQRTISTPSSVLGKFSGFETGSINETTMISRAVGQTSAGTSATAISTEEEATLTSAETQGAVAGNTEKELLQHFKKIT